MDESLVSDKRRRLDTPNVAPLNDLVRSWRSRGADRSIPWFDPDDGGTGAKVLILMESPAPRTVGPSGSNFCSLDNSDSSNRLLGNLIEEAGIRRADCLKWNAVPAALRDELGAPRAARRADVEDGAHRLREVLALTRRLQIVLTLGSAALSGFMLAITGEPPGRLYKVLAAPHPSQRNTSSRAQSLRRIENALRAIAADLDLDDDRA